MERHSGYELFNLLYETVEMVALVDQAYPPALIALHHTVPLEIPLYLRNEYPAGVVDIVI